MQAWRSALLPTSSVARRARDGAAPLRLDTQAFSPDAEHVYATRLRDAETCTHTIFDSSKEQVLCRKSTRDAACSSREDHITEHDAIATAFPE